MPAFGEHKILSPRVILRPCRLLAAMVLLTGLAGPLCAAVLKAPSVPDNLKIKRYFEANRGQTDASVRFFTRAAGYNLYLTASQAVTVLPRPEADKAGGPIVVRMKLKGANANPSVQGLNILPGRTSYFLGGDRSKWRTSVEQYASVKFGQVYPGIDMVYRFDQGHVEHDFILAPGADPGRILMDFEGGQSLRLDTRGSLLISVEGGDLTYKAPKLYQLLNDKRVDVKGRFVLAGGGQVRFEVGNYIKSKELVIDPEIIYSSYLGGSLDDRAGAVAVDASGNVYLTGSVVSTNFSLGFPVGSDRLQTINGGGASDVFVTKINAAGTAVVWSTYYGGSGNDIGRGIAVDGAGKVYITGSTTGSIPGRTHLFGTGGGTDAFVVAISSDANSLIYADQFGGPGEESGNGIAVDPAGDAYVTGHTNSANFPTLNPAQPANGGADDAFVAKFDAAGGQVYATYLGGTSFDHGNAIAIDSAGNAYVTGYCEAAFPVTGQAFKPTITGASDAFIAKLNQAGSAFLYVTYVGGSTLDEGTGIALDSANNIYITGWTDSTDFPGPGATYASMRTGSAQPTKGTGEDAFVFKLNIGGGGILDGVYSTYLGASGADRASAIAVDGGGNAYVTGHTASTDFPLKSPFSGGETQVGGGAFVTQISSTGGSFGFSSYLGGSTDEEGQGIALDNANNIYVTGWTNSADFPSVNAFQAANAGSFDAFITKLSPAVAAEYCVYIDTDDIPLGNIRADTEVMIGTKAVITNCGNVKVTFEFKATDITADSPWQISDTQGIDRFILWTAINNVQPLAADFGVEDKLTEVSVKADPVKFAIGGQTGVSVAPNEERTLWFKLLTPVSSNTDKEQKLNVTVTAGAP